MTVQTFVCNPYMQNTYVAHLPQAKECIIVDAGIYSPEEEQELTDYIRRQQLSVAAILITHAHPDHVCGRKHLQALYPEAQVVDYSYLRASFGEQEPVLQLAGITVRCLYTPGHKEDCVCYLCDETTLFSGDTLFRESIGRTDLDGGDYGVLMRSLDDLMQLPPQTMVYPGHSEPTTIAHERRYNPFIGR